MCGVALVPRGRFGPSRKRLEVRGGKKAYKLTGTGPRGAWLPRRGVGELLVVDLIDGAVDEHGRGHQRRRREGLPLVGRSPRDNMHDARRRRVGRAPPCVLAPPCVRTVMRNVHRRRCPRRLACSAYCRHRWRMCLLASQNRVQSRQLLQRRSNDSCRARCGWRVHLCVAARRFCTARDQRRKLAFGTSKARVAHGLTPITHLRLLRRPTTACRRPGRPPAVLAGTGGATWWAPFFWANFGAGPLPLF